jgi:Fic family protein
MAVTRLRRQPQGYVVFVPETLPPQPTVKFDQEMLRCLSDADRNLGRLDGVALTLPNPDLFLFMYVRKEAVLSSQIEGTQASLIEVLEYENNVHSVGNPQDIEEVINYVAAMNLGLQRLRTLPVSLRLIREIHKRLMRGVRGQNKSPGEFRRSQNWIGPHGCNIQQASFVPPPPHEMAQALDNLEKFIHSKDDIPILIRVGLVHAQFETIHPFLDGNGRIGRLLIPFMLSEANILQWPSLYISHYFRKYKSEYYSRLQNTRDRRDWEGWLKFFLRGISEVAVEGTQTATAILRLREDIRKQLVKGLSRSAAGHAAVLLDALYHRPVIDVQQASEIIGATYATANTLVSRLTGIGVLSEITGGQRNRKFSFASYLSLFADPPNHSSGEIAT